MLFNKATVATMITLAAAASVDQVVVSAAVPQRKTAKYSKKNLPSTLTPEEACEQDSGSTGYRWCGRTQTCDPPADDSCFATEPDPAAKFPTPGPILIPPPAPTSAPISIPPPDPTDGPTEELEPLLDLTDTLSEQGYTTFMSALTLVAAAKIPRAFNVPPSNAAFDDSIKQPITVFAPTNAAFEELGDDVLTCLFAPENIEMLQEILLYHVAEGVFLEQQLIDGDGVRADGLLMLNEGTAFVDRAPRGAGVIVGYESNEVVIIYEAAIEQPNMFASNGIAHGINGVLPPKAFRGDCGQGTGLTDYECGEVSWSAYCATEPEPSDGPTEEPEPLLDLADTLSEQGYTTFLVALMAADMVFGGGPLTIMAPTNAAFEALGEDLLACLFAFENVDTLQALLLYHMATGAFSEEQLINDDELLMLDEETVFFWKGPSTGTVNIGYENGFYSAAIEKPDMIALNGIAHGINGILNSTAFCGEEYNSFLETCAPEQPELPPVGCEVVFGVCDCFISSESSCAEVGGFFSGLCGYCNWCVDRENC